MSFLNIYLTKENDVIYKFVKDRYSYISIYKLLDTYIYNDDLKIFQQYDNYLNYCRKCKNKINSKIKKIIDFIIDL